MLVLYSIGDTCIHDLLNIQHSLELIYFQCTVTKEKCKFKLIGNNMKLRWKLTASTIWLINDVSVSRSLWAFKYKCFTGEKGWLLNSSNIDNRLSFLQINWLFWFRTEIKRNVYYSCSFFEQFLSSSNIDGSFSNRSKALMAAWVSNGGADAEKQ